MNVRPHGAIALLSWIALPLGAQETFSVGHSFTNMGTTEETTRVIDGVTFTCPVDEADVIDLILPTIAAFRETRRQRAPAEAKAFGEAFSDPEYRKMILDRVQELLGADSLSATAEATYDRILEDIESLANQWAQWSGDLLGYHLYNHATVAPFRDGETRVKFDQITYQLKKDGDFEISVSPSFVAPGIGIGSFDPERLAVAPFELESFNLVVPGNSAEAVAEVQKRIINLAAALHGQLATGELTRLAAHHLLESLLIHEIETRFFAEDPPRLFTRGLAHFHLFVHLLAVKGTDNIPSWLPRFHAYNFESDPEGALEDLDSLAKLNLLEDIPPEFEVPAGRMFTETLVQLSLHPGNKLTFFPYLDEKGVEIPEGVFTRESFIEAMDQAYPVFRRELATARKKMTERFRQLIARQMGETPEATQPPPDDPDPPDPIPNRKTRETGGTIFSYPSSLETAVSELAPGWAEGLDRFRVTLKERFKDNLEAIPPVHVGDETLEAIRTLGIPAERAAADDFAMQAAVMANFVVIFLRIFDGNEVEIWIKDELRELLKAGTKIEGFSLNPDGKSVDFNFAAQTQFPITPDMRVEDFIDAFDDVSAPALPIVVVSDNDLSKASLEEQIAGLKKGAEIVEGLISAADTLSPEQILQKKIRSLDDRQSFFVTVHEVVESGLIRKVIAAKDRRWFCDGVANLVAIRECDRRFGKDTGFAVFESLFPPEQSRSFASQIDLLKWPASGDSSPSVAEEVDGLDSAHYYFSTLALLAATEDRDEKFLAEWIARIRETSWNRTNAETVIAAYRDLTKNDLRKILEEAVSAEPGKPKE